MLICSRCNKTVPDGLIACDCFILHAEEEKIKLALRRFFSGEVLLFIRESHIYPQRRHCRSICGVEEIKASNEMKTYNLSSDSTKNMIKMDDVTCEQCRGLVTSDPNLIQS